MPRVLARGDQQRAWAGRLRWPVLAAAKPLTGSTLAIKAAAMTSRISHTSFDALDAYAQSVFWSQVLDFTQDPDDPNEPGHQECLIMSRDQSQLLLFITVPDGKTMKNRSTWTCDRPTAPASRRPSGSSRSGHRSWPTTGGLMAAAGLRSPILRATSSAS